MFDSSDLEPGEEIAVAIKESSKEIYFVSLQYAGKFFEATDVAHWLAIGRIKLVRRYPHNPKLYKFIQVERQK